MVLSKKEDMEKRRADGIAHPWKSKIWISDGLNNQEFVSCVFHEIQHCLNYRNRKYFNYHKGNASLKDLRRLALRAEIYTDIKAEKLARAFGFNNYVKVYNNSLYWKRYFKEFFNGK
jgi:hypothetical protein